MTSRPKLTLPELTPERGGSGSAGGPVSRVRAARVLASASRRCLPGDNQHWAAVPVKDSLLIRLVDGEPSAEPFGSEVDYLAAPLSIGIGAAEAWRVEIGARPGFPVAAAGNARRAGAGQRGIDHARGGRTARIRW